MMGNSKDRARSALLFEYLLHSTAKDLPAPRDQLCDYLDCDRKTLAREIRALRECGFDIRMKKTGKQNAYYYGKNDLSLAEMQVWFDEAQAGGYLSAESERKLDSALEKLSGSRRAELVRGSTLLFNTRKHSDAPVLRTVEVLRQAIVDQKQASFQYFDWDENHQRVYRRDGTRYQVQPIGLVNKDDNYYLMTWHAERGSIAPYRLDRIEAAIESEEPVCQEAVEARAHVAEFTRQAFRMYGGETACVTLQFTRAAINYVFDKFGGEVKIQKLNEDLYEAELEVQLSPPFWGWMFQFAEIMQITAPEHVLKQYKARLASVRRTNHRKLKQLAAVREAAAAAGETAEPEQCEQAAEAEVAEAQEQTNVDETAEMAEQPGQTVKTEAAEQDRQAEPAAETETAEMVEQTVKTKASESDRQAEPAVEAAEPSNRTAENDKA